MVVWWVETKGTGMVVNLVALLVVMSVLQSVVRPGVVMVARLGYRMVEKMVGLKVAQWVYH